ncbi:MAG: HEPN domain-containing protein [bacterium]
MRSKSERWLEQAIHDLEDARFNLSGGRYNVACFLAQQAAEKALKAFLLKKGADEVWGHSIADLCEDAKNFDPSFVKIEREIVLLDKYYLPTRYPDALPGGIPSYAFDEEDAKRAITISEKAINFVKERL